ncbi:MAG: sigma 54-interacting transcriptional regulator [Fidelibacterota bacterium]
MRNKINFFIISLLLSTCLLGQEDKLSLISLDFHKSINVIHQDNQGYIWFGTTDGLYKYDGQDYDSYKIDPYNENSISDDHITDICETDSSVLLVGTKFGGLNSLDLRSGKFSFFMEAVTGSANISAIDHDNYQIWFGTDDGLFYWNLNADSTAIIPAGISQHITDIEIIDDNTLLAATGDNGFYKLNFSPVNEKILVLEHFLETIDVNFIFPVKENLFLISTKAGFYLYDEAKTELIKIDQENFSEKIFNIQKNAMVRDEFGNLWLGSGYKIYKISPVENLENIKIHTYEINIETHNSTGIHALYYDRSGVLWISLKGKGLYKYYPARNFSHHTIDKGLMSNVIFSFAGHNSNSILIGTHHGIFVYDFSDNSSYRLPGTEELNYQVITAMYRDGENNLWCGTNNGLYKITPQQGVKHYQYSARELSSISSNFITSIVGDPLNKGDIWVGTQKGLNRYRSQYDNFLHYFPDENFMSAISGEHITSLHFTTENDLLIGTAEYGLSLLPGTEINSMEPEFVSYRNDFDDRYSISDDKINFVTQDFDGHIWVGTENGGLNKLDSSGRFSHYLETNGMINNCILAIVPTRKGQLWISTPDGIARLSVNDGQINNYFNKDGLQNCQFLPRASFLMRNGYILMGTKNGFTYFHPSNIRKNPKPAIPQVKGLYVFNKIVDQSVESPLEFSYDQDVVSFDIRGLHYVSPENNQLAYFLEGVDEDWNYCKNYKYLTYSHLAPGDYTFHLKAANFDHVWNEQEKVINFQIRYPFWKTLWFKILLILVSTGAIYLIIQYRTRKVRKSKLVLQKQIKEKNEINERLNHALLEVENLKIKLENENTFLKHEIEINNHIHYKEIVTNSNKMQNILQQIEIASGADPTILILGESGTGKDLLAHAIHKSSSRRKECFIKVDCASLPPNLIESELFGHEKGAFTGANKRKIGRFELANGGTIFLDEIGELPIKVQQKLLRVLQNGEFERLGNSITLQTNTRIIAATNRNLEEEVKTGQFREDLFYRLNVFPINLPPLRERMEDIPLLVKHFVNKYCEKFNKTISKIPQSTINKLMKYRWPGNIRELENIIQRAIIVSSADILELGEWFESLKKERRSDTGDSLLTLEELQRRHIEKILEYTKGKVSGENGAAEILKINPKTLFSRMKKLNINN